MCDQHQFRIMWGDGGSSGRYHSFQESPLMTGFRESRHHLRLLCKCGSLTVATSIFDLQPVLSHPEIVRPAILHSKVPGYYQIRQEVVPSLDAWVHRWHQTMSLNEYVKKMFG